MEHYSIIQYSSNSNEVNEMKTRVVKIPSRYEIIEVADDIDKVNEFLKRRDISTELGADDISRYIVVSDKYEGHSMTIRPGYNLIITGSHVVAVELKEFNEWSTLIEKLSLMYKEECKK